MSNPSSRAQRYRERVAECILLAEIAQDAALRDGYLRIAERYAALAEAQTKLDREQPRRRRKRSGLRRAS